MDKLIDVLVIDDEEFNITMLKGLLEDEYHVTGLKSGKECLLSIEDHKPDVLLLDVNMPEIDGLECCRRLRAKYSNLELPILFVSGLTSDEDRLEGYKAGGDDYITKPYNEDELLHKIKAILAISREGQALQESSLESQKMAHDALNNIFEIGNILSFVKNSFSCNTYEELSTKLFGHLKSFNLRASILVSENKQNSFYFDDGHERPLEVIVLTKVHESDTRIIDIGSKIVFNSPKVAILIRNMPTEDKELLGRLKDLFITLIEALNSRIRGITAELSQTKKHDRLSRIIDATKKSLTEIEAEQLKQQMAISSIISDIGGKIEHLFINLALEGNQEDAIIEVISEAEHNSDQLFEQGVSLETRFELIIAALENAK